uniref:BTB domain-containing protein n=1 Tax=Ditylenchus dipsaci TaxID=166011 RepID=A0A915CZ00_9BILA
MNNSPPHEAVVDLTSHLLNDIAEMPNLEPLTDICFITEGVRFPANKTIMALRSEYLVMQPTDYNLIIDVLCLASRYLYPELEKALANFLQLHSISEVLNGLNLEVVQLKERMCLMKNIGEVRPADN